MAEAPRLLVFSSLFPSAVQPAAGLFIRERMFRVARHLPLTVVAPVPWFPLQSLIRLFRPGYRPMPPRREVQEGIVVWHPRFLAVPGLLRTLDGFAMAAGSVLLLRRLKREFGFEVIDAHFAYPDGYAASLLGRWFKVPVTITLRGTEVPHARHPGKRRRMLRALASAARVFSVAEALKRHLVSLGAEAGKIEVVGNGVDTEIFRPEDKQQARARLGIPAGAKVLISVGGLVERKGFHRVIDVLPRLCREFSELVYLIVGGPSPEGDMREALADQVERLGLGGHVRFLGVVAPAELRWPLSAADVFVLATRNEGWANVFLEAMACGLPVITTDVGGNREVVAQDHLGEIVPFGDGAALEAALRRGLTRPWDRDRIRQYAVQNGWQGRIDRLVQVYRELTA
jgi:glycosyltransferase involved in cell wall biosynthesis